MSKNDDFDKFLKNKFQNAEYSTKDEGFTKRVISNLPTNKSFSIKRNFILGSFSILSVFLFIILSGYKSLLVSIIEIFNNGFYLIKPSLTSIFVMIVFVCVSFFITNIEYNRNSI
jgi:hypothetical protein